MDWRGGGCNWGVADGALAVNADYFPFDPSLAGILGERGE